MKVTQRYDKMIIVRNYPWNEFISDILSGARNEDETRKMDIFAGNWIFEGKSECRRKIIKEDVNFVRKKNGRIILSLKYTRVMSRAFKDKQYLKHLRVRSMHNNVMAIKIVILYMSILVKSEGS